MKLIFLVLAAISLSALAKPQDFKLAQKTVTLDIPAGNDWETDVELFGIPLAVLGPWEKDSRPVISILPTNLTKQQVSASEFPKLFSDFKTEKDEWVKSHKGKLISYEPTKDVMFGKDLSGHFIGAEFVINDIHFIERSYYLWCGGEIYNLKYSLRDYHKKHLPELQKIVENFKCK
jgi:hypothetical protein